MHLWKEGKPININKSSKQDNKDGTRMSRSDKWLDINMAFWFMQCHYKVP